MLLRLLCAAILAAVGSMTLAVGHGGSARAAGYETLMVPSAAITRRRASISVKAAIPGGWPSKSGAHPGEFRIRRVP